MDEMLVESKLFLPYTREKGVEDGNVNVPGTRSYRRTDRLIKAGSSFEVDGKALKSGHVLYK